MIVPLYNVERYLEEEFRAASNKNSLNPGYFTMHYWIEIELLLQDVDAYFARYANLSGKKAKALGLRLWGEGFGARLWVWRTGNLT